jgi:ferritin-like metal-binding protein YciE
MTDQGEQKIIELLIEAHSNELALVNVLESHIKLADRGSYRSLLETHLRETKTHGDRVGRRLAELGHRESLIGMGYGVIQGLLKQTLVMAKAPIDAVRGAGDVKEKALRNARDEIMTEGLEIAAYDTIESVARSLGDNETAELAAEIRVDEEQMFEALRKELPILSDAFVRSQIPVQERNVDEPWEGYDEMTVEAIVVQLGDASESLVLAVRNYEKGNKNRSTVLRGTDREPV